jgi:hypothetical protein
MSHGSRDCKQETFGDKLGHANPGKAKRDGFHSPSAKILPTSRFHPPRPGFIRRWMLEELRISLFAQELKTTVPVSLQRLEKLWEQVPAR